ncbi:MAG TPA: PIN domain-containing protein [Opitutaceae bacterium]
MVLVDSNVLLDVLTDDPRWRRWSEEQLLAAVETDELAINPIIFAELSPAYRAEAELERALRGWTLQRLALTYEAGFLAGQAYVRYRRGGGQRHSPLPDFFIGAHAQTERLTLLTRETARYRTYFPHVTLIAPE